MKKFFSHGDGNYRRENFGSCGENLIIEAGVKIFHEENIFLGNNIYFGHNSIIKGYYNNKITIGDGVWIGQNVFLHGGGGIIVGNNVGIGPGVTLLSSFHNIEQVDTAIMSGELVFKSVQLLEGCDIGVNSIILPGITIGKCAQVGAGSVVTKSVGDYEIVAGNPAKLLRKIEIKK